MLTYIGRISWVCLLEGTGNLDLGTRNSAATAIKVDLSTADVELRVQVLTLKWFKHVLCTDLRETRWVRVVDTHALNAQEVFAVGDANGEVKGIGDLRIRLD